jgi:hypothetical protein
MNAERVICLPLYRVKNIAQNDEFGTPSTRGQIKERTWLFLMPETGQGFHSTKLNSILRCCADTNVGAG